MARPNRKPANTPASEAWPPDADTTTSQPIWLAEHLRPGPGGAAGRRWTAPGADQAACWIRAVAGAPKGFRA